MPEMSENAMRVLVTQTHLFRIFCSVAELRGRRYHISVDLLAVHFEVWWGVGHVEDSLNVGVAVRDAGRYWVSCESNIKQ
jgi:hypothetical protein